MLFMTNTKASIVERTTSLYVLVEQEIDRYRPLANEKGIELVAHLDRNVTVQCDPVRIARAIGNLLSNAIKFTLNDGRVDVEVTDENGFAVLTIMDSGIGIPPEELRLVLNRFFRGSATADNAIDGIGVVLTIKQGDRRGARRRDRGRKRRRQRHARSHETAGWAQIAAFTQTDDLTAGEPGANLTHLGSPLDAATAGFALGKIGSSHALASAAATRFSARAACCAAP